MNFIIPRVDILPPAQKAVWPLLSKIEHGFVLYGGTAIALHFGHRESIDFDFFGEPTFDPESLKTRCQFLKNGETIQVGENTLSVVTSFPSGRVKFSFFGGLKFGRAATPYVCEDTLLRLASPLDLAVQKLKVIQVRSEVKDFRDLDCLLQNGINLADAMGAAEAIYPGFPIAIALRAMCYFDDGDVSTLPIAAKKRLVNEANRFKSPSPMTRQSEHLDLPLEAVEELKLNLKEASAVSRPEKVVAARAMLAHPKLRGSRRR